MTKATAKIVKPRTKAECASERVRLSCRIGRNALEDWNVEYAMFNLLHAVEDLAVLITEINKSQPNE